MSDIATKLTAIAENQQKVYNAGHEKGVTYGKEAERNEFWDNLLPASYPGYPYMFYCWAMNNFKPTKDINFFSFSNPNYAFYQTSVLDTTSAGNPRYQAYDLVELLEKYGVNLRLQNVTNVSSMFQNSSVTRVPVLDFSQATNTNLVFSGCYALTTIEGLIVSEVTAGLMCFSNCFALKKLTIEGTIAKNCNFSTCTALSHDSLMSIINALKTYTNGATQKITIGATNIAKLTADELDQIEAKGWTYA